MTVSDAYICLGKIHCTIDRWACVGRDTDKLERQEKLIMICIDLLEAGYADCVIDRVLNEYCVNCGGVPCIKGVAASESVPLVTYN